jgi:hypothetical protein
MYTVTIQDKFEEIVSRKIFPNVKISPQSGHPALGRQAGLHRFFSVQHTKKGKIYQITLKYTKRSQNIPNGCKIDQTAINLPTSCIAIPSKIYPNWDFWIETTPSGNPAFNLKFIASKGTKSPILQ